MYINVNYDIVFRVISLIMPIRGVYYEQIF